MRLPYRHGYHAGSSADVFKHSVLVLLLHHMRKKQAPSATAGDAPPSPSGNTVGGSREVVPPSTEEMGAGQQRQAHPSPHRPSKVGRAANGASKRGSRTSPQAELERRTMEQKQSHDDIKDQLRALSRA